MSGSMFIVEDSTDAMLPQAQIVVIADRCGEWACERIAHFQRLDFVGPVVVVVDEFREQIAVLGYGCGALAWEALPLRATAFVAQLDALASRLIGCPDPPDVAVRLVPSTFSAVIDEEVVKFKPRAFAVFAYLLGRREIWTTPRRVMQDVFETNHSSDSSVVRMQIRNIRAALGPKLAWILAGAEGRGYQVTLSWDSTAGRRLSPHPRYRGPSGGASPRTSRVR